MAATVVLAVTGCGDDVSGPVTHAVTFQTDGTAGAAIIGAETQTVVEGAEVVLQVRATYLRNRLALVN